MKPAGLLALLFVLGCSQPEAESDAGVAVDSTPTVAVHDPDHPDSIAARFRARVPDSLLVRHNVCPFECCIYRDWTTETPIPVVRAQLDTGAPLFTMPAGTTYKADSGNVHIRGIAVVAVADTAKDGPTAVWALPGDTLVVLDYVGEGHYNVWQNGKVREVEGFWGAEQSRNVASLLGRYAAEWWVHVTLPDGRTGWYKAESTMRVKNADACA